MVRRCCIRTCRNSRPNCDEKVPLFKVPNKGPRLDEWVKAIAPTGSELHKTSSICERHFNYKDVVRHVVINDTWGDKMFEVPRIKCTLEKDAVPTIFKKDRDDEAEAAEACKKKRKEKRVLPKIVSDERLTACAGPPSILNNAVIVQFVETPVIRYNVLSTSTTTCSNSDSSQLLAQLPTITLASGADSSAQSDKLVENEVDEQLFNYVVNGERSELIEGALSESLIDVNELLNESEKTESPEKAVIDHPTVVSANSTESLKEARISIPEQRVEPPANKTPSSPAKKKPTGRKMLNSSSLDQLEAFELIFRSSRTLKLPNSNWGYHKNGADESVIIFSKARWFDADGLVPPVYEKQVVLHELDSVKIYINNKFSPLEVRRPSNVEEMELLLRSVDETVVCSGGLSIDEYDNVPCSQKDYAVRRWRHKLCPIVLKDSEKICKFCVTISEEGKHPKIKRLWFGKVEPVKRRDSNNNGKEEKDEDEDAMAHKRKRRKPSKLRE